MKLARQFYRLPIRFNVERLRAEVESLPAGAWSRHPKEREGNTAARLITVGGGENDATSGEMKPTPALAACPYIQQVLASFNTVWSRSRLMRIAGGAMVPPHSDMNLHWFHRVRVHIPVITRPEVRLHCGGESVHMVAGEAWIFDNWREHKVLNPASDARIHLVADTSGTSAFWRLVAQGQSENFEQPNPAARFVAFDPVARPGLMIERFNAALVMPPTEVEQLSCDLLADLASADQKPDSIAAVGQLVALMIDFCHDWRALWSLHGDAPEGRGQYEQLAGAIRQKVARLLAYLLGGAGAPRRDAAEFNAANAAAGGNAPVSAGRVQRRRMVIDEPSVVERPLIILSAPRAGSTLLFETLAQAAGIYTIGGDSHRLIETIDGLRPGRGTATSNRLTAEDATAPVVAELRRRLATNLRDRDAQEPAPRASCRLLEKTPKNALRVPFFFRVFPDAMFIFLHREPRANLSSIMEAWRSDGWVTYRQLPGWPGPWSLLLPPGYECLRDRPLEEIVAFQWRAANETILDDLAGVPRERWTTARYEDLLKDPAAAAAVAPHTDEARSREVAEERGCDRTRAALDRGDKRATRCLKPENEFPGSFKRL